MGTFLIHDCKFFNLFIHTGAGIYLNQSAEIDIIICADDCTQEQAILQSEPQSTYGSPGFYINMTTIPGNQYYIETEAILIEGEQAILYVESIDPNTRLVSREEHMFLPGQNTFYGVQFEAVSTTTRAGILFCDYTCNNRMIINQFRVAPFFVAPNFQNVLSYKVLDCFPDVLGLTGSAILEDLIGIVGPTGSQGPQGPDGPQGPMAVCPAVGPQGPQGSQGPRGLDGDQGPQGTQGPAGRSGPQGTQGPVGPVGPIGGVGAQGPQGPAGPQGVQGPLGPVGINGEPGLQGPTGTSVTMGIWETLWSRDGGVATSIEYQRLGDIVTLSVPAISFTPGGTATLETTVAMPVAIQPSLLSQDTVRIIEADGGIARLVRVSVVPSNVLISSDLMSGTEFTNVDIDIPDMTLTYNI
jgi:hypothetical protein